MAAVEDEQRATITGSPELDALAGMRGEPLVAEVQGDVLADRDRGVVGVARKNEGVPTEEAGKADSEDEGEARQRPRPPALAPRDAPDEERQAREAQQEVDDGW